MKTPCWIEPSGRVHLLLDGEEWGRHDRFAEQHGVTGDELVRQGWLRVSTQEGLRFAPIRGAATQAQVNAFYDTYSSMLGTRFEYQFKDCLEELTA